MLFRHLIIGALSLLLVRPARSPGAEAKVIAPRTAPAGSYFLLDGSQSIASQRVTWKLIDPDVAVYRSGDGRKIVLLVPTPRTLCLSLEATDSDNSTDSQLLRIQIGASSPPAPGPAPQPNPQPSPQPVEPDLGAGRLGLATAARDECRKLTHPTRVAEIPQVVAQLVKLRTRIQSGAVDVQSVVSLKSALDQLQRENRDALGTSVKLWSPWGEWWSSAMKDLYLDGKLATPADWIDAIDETTTGLNAARKPGA